MAEPIRADATIRQLCLRCGICCNGVLFRDVELEADDLKRPALRHLGTNLLSGLPAKLPQPCAALGPDGRCRVYAERPGRCRAFECALFKEVQAGRREVPAALRVIRTTLERAERVKALLRQLGDTEETRALSLRFQRLQRSLQACSLTEESAAAYAELTLAVHDLNLMLGKEFHP